MKVKRHQLEKTLLVDPWNSVQEADLVLVLNPSIPAVLVLNKVDLLKAKHTLLDINRRPDGRSGQWQENKRPFSGQVTAREGTTGLNGQRSRTSHKCRGTGLAPLSGRVHAVCCACRGGGSSEELSNARGQAGVVAVPQRSADGPKSEDICNQHCEREAPGVSAQEVPYNVTQVIEMWQEGENGTLDILLKLYVKKDSHMKIVIGQAGQVVARIAREAGEDLTSVFLRDVKLKISVKTGIGRVSSKAMFLHEERPFCDYSLPLNLQQNNIYTSCPPEWKDAVLRSQCRDATKVDAQAELCSQQTRVSLQGRELWDKFRDTGTEMIITKTGRRMFPACKVSVTGLNPNTKYVLMMDMVPFDDNKYKWNKDKWEVNGVTEPHLPNRFFIHPDSPALGGQVDAVPSLFPQAQAHQQHPQHQWHAELRTTNVHSEDRSVGLIDAAHLKCASTAFLVSHRCPHIVYCRPLTPCSPLSGGYLRFTFPEAAFIAVTAYQNPEITKLKIDNNPFAKGFRDHGLNSKRQRERPVQNSRKQPVESSHETETHELYCGVLPTQPAVWRNGQRASSYLSNQDVLPATPYTSSSHYEARPSCLPNGGVPVSSRPPHGQSSESLGYGSLSRLPQALHSQSSRAADRPQRPGNHPPAILEAGMAVKGEVQTAAGVRLPSSLPSQGQQGPPPRMHSEEPGNGLSPVTPAAPRPLTDILNRIRGRRESSPGKLPQAPATWLPLALGKEALAQSYQSPLDHSSEYLVLQGMLGYPSSMATSAQLSSGHADNRVPLAPRGVPLQNASA
ncbi:hypothetical protein SKAU_G00328260 [Synaphobranchus kaupii]|uniref:T-box domain-containing protein n=1 Tax=Synaphobranchus kaupii TaxID=118154 RepID=A0A9Q1IIC7_SYNKA|nr:hypothetical protein SKAU_G00328260 [Synaphobranchus kaupii]